MNNIALGESVMRLRQAVYILNEEIKIFKNAVNSSNRFSIPVQHLIKSGNESIKELQKLGI